MNGQPQRVTYEEDPLWFERLIAGLSKRFIHLAPYQVDSEIEAAQKLVCQTLGLDRSTLAQWDDDAKTLLVTHSWVVPGYPSGHEFKTQDLPWMISKILRGETICFARLSELPEEAAKDRETASRFGTKSNVTFPLSAGGQTFGALGFGMLRAEREWPEPLVGRLRLIADVFASAIARKRSDEALLESQERMRLAVESAALGLWTWNIQGGEVWASERTYSLFGWPLGTNLTFERFIDAVHPDDRAHVQSSMERAAQLPVEFRLEHRIVRPDGTVRWVINQGTSRADAVGRPAFMSGVVLDITERIRAAEIVRNSEDLFRLAANSAPVMIWMTGTDKLCSFLSEGWLSFTGRTMEEELGEEWVTGVHPDDVNRCQGIYAAAFDARLKFEMEYRLRRFDGEYCWIFDRGAPHFHSDGTFRGYIGSCIDITDRKLSEQVLLDLNQRLFDANRQVERMKEQLEHENIYLREEIKVEHNHHEVVGQSEAIRRVLMSAEQVAVTDSAVLLLGETGTGKELIARTIHEHSRRKGRLMVKVNCAALPASLVESELFGRERGAFTGALTREIGRFELANGSTILLDEIGELPLELQAKLLRVLQEGEFERLGSSKTIHVDARLIAATSRDLGAAVKGGRFREDLYYRLNVFPIQVPPLRERRDDIPMLTWHFLRELGRRMGRDVESVRAATMKGFQSYSWPGNVRELRNVIERHLILNPGPVFEAEVPKRGEASALAGGTAEEVERSHVLRVLESTSWRIRGQGGAAEILGLKPTTLESRMKKLGVVRQ